MRSNRWRGSATLPSDTRKATRRSRYVHHRYNDRIINVFFVAVGRIPWLFLLTSEQ